MLRLVILISVLVTCLFIVKAQDFNIVDFGAKADGVTHNTVPIQSAIDAAYAQGGGRVVIPAGRFLTGSIHMKSGVELHLSKDAVLLGSTDPEQYERQGLWYALLMADRQDNIGITGRGVIDGQGRQLALHIDSLFYAGRIDSADYEIAEKRPKYYLRPQLIVCVECRNIEVRNVSLYNSASWVQLYDQCEDIMLDSVHIYSDAYWNNDGIDISDCTNVRITNCDINVSDDGICLKSHSKDHSCDSVYIANCTVRSSASAVKLGARSYGGFKNVTIENIKVYDTFRSAVAIECVDGGTIENILVDNIEAVNTGNAIFIRLGERNSPAGLLRNITIRNLMVEVAFGRPDQVYEIRGPELPFFHNTFPSSITGIPGHPVENVVLENIEIVYPGRGNNGLANIPLSRLDAVPEKIAEYPEFSMFGELPAWGLYVRHVDGLALRNIKLSIQDPDYRPAMVFDGVRNLDVKSLDILGENKEKHSILHNTTNVTFDDDKSVLRLE